MPAVNVRSCRGAVSCHVRRSWSTRQRASCSIAASIARGFRRFAGSHRVRVRTGVAGAAQARTRGTGLSSVVATSGGNVPSVGSTGGTTLIPALELDSLERLIGAITLLA